MAVKADDDGRCRPILDMRRTMESDLKRPRTVEGQSVIPVAYSAVCLLRERTIRTEHLRVLASCTNDARRWPGSICP